LKVVVNGASIAGTALAYCLRRMGYEALLVERALRCAPAGTRSTCAAQSGRDRRGRRGPRRALHRHCTLLTVPPPTGNFR
jgi:2-polyprenyl-6-methoxyphenol hydroxylase-like FAD-dependent oxidoreductase